MCCITKETTKGCTICTIPWWFTFRDVTQIAPYHKKFTFLGLP